MMDGWLKLFFTSFFLIAFLQGSKLENKLIMANIIFRNAHTDPESVNNNIPEMLTKTGMITAYHLGEILYERFGNKKLFTQKNEGIAPHNVYAISSEKMPCYQTCQLVSASLLAPKGTPREWNRELDWIPFKMYLERENDGVILTDYDDYRKNIREIANYRRRIGDLRKLLSESKEFLKSLETKLGHKINDRNIWTTFNKLETAFYASKSSEKTYLNIQKWINRDIMVKYQVILDKLQNIIFDGGDEMFARSFGGNLLHSLIQNMNQSDEGYKKKLYLYSGDEMILQRFISALNNDRGLNYTFLSGFSFELYEDNKKEQFVELYYFDSSHLNKQFHLLEIKNCAYPCKLTTFISNYKKRSEPLQLDIIYSIKSRRRKIVIGVTVFLFLGLLVYCLSITYMYLRERNNRWLFNPVN